MKIYVASSWRNKYQQDVVKELREYGHDVYDFKNPPNSTGFNWKQIESGKDYDKQLGSKYNNATSVEGTKVNEKIN